MASKCSRIFHGSVSKLKSTIAKPTPSVRGRPAMARFAKSTRTFLSRSPVELGAAQRSGDGEADFGLELECSEL